ncbi:phosphatidylglycerol lysyltransferase domain-containing protein [Streptomyces buecherae]
MHDLGRRQPDEVPGIMEAVNKAAIETFRSEGAAWLHFGFTPFAGLSREREVPGASEAFSWFTHWLWENGSAVYPARSQLAYKQKWTPHAILPDYIAFQGRAQLGGLLHLFKAATVL